MEFFSNLFHSITLHLLASWSAGAGKECILTISLILFAALLTRAHARYVRARVDLAPKAMRQSHSTFRNLAWIFTFSAVAFVWAGEIRSLIFSLAAIFASLLVVGKELLTSILASLVWSISKPAKLGDHIEIKGLKGELLDRGWLHLEILDTSDALNGAKIAKLPLSYTLTEPLFNHSALGVYGWSRIEAHCHPTQALDCARIMLSEAHSVSGAWLERAKEEACQSASKRMIKPAEILPSVEIKSLESDQALVVCRVPVPKPRKLEIEQLILAAWLEECKHLRTTDPQ